MKRCFTFLLSGVLIRSCSPVWAQATAQVSGTVKDSSGAVLPGVEITTTQTDTGVVRTTVTDETGSFIYTETWLWGLISWNLVPGFRTFVQTGIACR